MYEEDTKKQVPYRLCAFVPLWFWFFRQALKRKATCPQRHAALSTETMAAAFSEFQTAFSL